MPVDPRVIVLVIRAREGDQDAWDELIERYAPMIWSIGRRYRMDRPDIDDVAQTVWLRLVESLADLHDPGAVGSWLATTTKHECFRTVKARRRQDSMEQTLDFDMTADEQATMVEQELETAERNAILRAAFAKLPPTCQRILLLRIEGISYEEIGARLDLPIGSLGPKRGRCLAKLRDDPALNALILAEIGAPGNE
ncbi:sigma-70 family RNA polymerase sigma factor [Streptosporangiaceae bacterium NEAU-GS5]|nr:sigma-70 family RNA polymerase sigma factor [Streptosporangiaceae bacterium NEAU-GS5]